MRHFRSVFDSRPSLFAPKPKGNACYAGYLRRCCLSSLINKKAECLTAESNWVWAEEKKAKGSATAEHAYSMTSEISSLLKIYSMAYEKRLRKQMQMIGTRIKGDSGSWLLDSSMGTERTDDVEVGVVSQDHLIDKVPWPAWTIYLFRN